METIKEIEKAISSLPEKELAKFRAWYTKFDTQLWDLQFEDDVRDGKLDNMANEAVEDYEDGKFKEL